MRPCRFVTLSLAFLLLCPVSTHADITVTFIDVGQGDAIWVHDDTGYDVLIDGGDRGEGDACEPDPCDQDSDGDGCCNCVDECPTDPAKCDPGQCGCSEGEVDKDGDCDGPLAECQGHCMDCVDECPNDDGACVLDPYCGCPGAPFDWDGDGVPNCEDQCPGIDDTIFGPDGGRATSCVGAIPTVSTWGLVVLALFLLVAGKVYFGRRTVTA